MTTALIIFGILTAFYSCFYFGYLKREGKPPDKMPIVSDLMALATATKPERPDKEEEKANTFFN